MLDYNQKAQLETVFSELESHYLLRATVTDGHAQKPLLLELLDELTQLSDKLSYDIIRGTGLCLSLIKDGTDTGISFRGIPAGYEFTSLIMALLHSDHKGKLQIEESLLSRARNLPETLRMTTYVSMSCRICPEVVQALNTITVINPGITHEMVDGSINKMEIIDREVRALPTVYANDKLLHVGMADFKTLVEKLELLSE